MEMSDLRYRNDPAYRERQSLAKRKARADSIAKGVCYRCGDPLAKGKSQCQPCLDLEAERRREERRKHREAAIAKRTPAKIKAGLMSNPSYLSYNCIEDAETDVRALLLYIESL
jgi:hypothetical protein